MSCTPGASWPEVKRSLGKRIVLISPIRQQFWPIYWQALPNLANRVNFLFERYVSRPGSP
jgi:hypothetical protein